MVVGGGVAGMEAARVAALRGHVVALYEKSDRLGGVVIPGGVPDFKEDEHALIRWYERELRELKVPLTFNTEATEDLSPGPARCADPGDRLEGENAPLANEPHVYTAEDVLNGDKPADDKTVVIGGGLVGCELALWLADQGKTTTVVEIAPKILAEAGPLCHANSAMLKELMEFKAVKVMTSSTVEHRVDGGYVVRLATRRRSSRRIWHSGDRLRFGAAAVRQGPQQGSRSLSLRRCAARAEHHVRDLGRLRGRAGDLTPGEAMKISAGAEP